MPKLFWNIVLLFVPFYASSQYFATKDTVLMGSAFNFTAIHHNEETARQAIHQAVNEVIRIEALISSWQTTSQTYLINKHAGKQAIKADWELFQLIYRCKKISILTNGYFDISFASLDNIWKFDGSQTSIPSEQSIKASVSKINFENIILNKKDTTVFLKENNMKIGFGAIGKGYAANRAKSVMVDLGVENGVVNAGGDIINWGYKPDGSNWNTGIANPNNKQDILSYLDVSNMAIVTSGNYEKFIEINGQQYTHIINPKTGWPVKGLKSVTVICPDAELADALATSVFVMGRDKGLELINTLANVECFVVDDENEIWYSKGINIIKK